MEAMDGEMMEGMAESAAEALRFEAAAETWDAAADGTDTEHDPGPDPGPGLGLPFEAHLNPMELRLARKIVDGLEPQDPQEEMHTWHLAVSHILAAQRFGKSRQEGLSARAEQIEIGLAVRLMTLSDRKSAALDRHRTFRLKAAEQASLEAAARAYREADEAKRAAEEAEREERIGLRSRDWEAHRQERLEAAMAQGESDGAPPEGPSAAGTARDP